MVCCETNCCVRFILLAFANKIYDMKRYFYLHMTPEALIASMLPPKEFGTYMAVGTKKRTRGQSVFFELDPELISNLIPQKVVEEKCVPHPDGKPKNSKYLSIYNVFQKIPLNAFKSLYLTTDDGRVLELTPSEYKGDSGAKMHLYQEIAPVSPRVASNLGPEAFGKHLTNEEKLISVPQLFFVELRLDDLADNPETGEMRDLPYQNFHHLRDCLMQLKDDPKKKTKTVDRFFKGALIYRTCINGFFIANQTGMLYFKLPNECELERDHFNWWRSAALAGLS